MMQTSHATLEPVKFPVRSASRAPWTRLRALRGLPVGGTARLLAVALFDYVGARATAWPSVETLAADIGKTTRTVRRLLRQLAAVGLFTRTWHWVKGKWRRTFEIPEGWRLPLNSCPADISDRKIEVSPSSDRIMGSEEQRGGRERPPPAALGPQEASATVPPAGATRHAVVASLPLSAPPPVPLGVLSCAWAIWLRCYGARYGREYMRSPQGDGGAMLRYARTLWLQTHRDLGAFEKLWGRICRGYLSDAGRGDALKAMRHPLRCLGRDWACYASTPSPGRSQNPGEHAPDLVSALAASDIANRARAFLTTGGK